MVIYPTSEVRVSLDERVLIEEHSSENGNMREKEGNKGEEAMLC